MNSNKLPIKPLRRLNNSTDKPEHEGRNILLPASRSIHAITTNGTNTPNPANLIKKEIRGNLVKREIHSEKEPSLEKETFSSELSPIEEREASNDILAQDSRSSSDLELVLVGSDDNIYSVSNVDTQSSFEVTFPHTGTFCSLIEYLYGSHGSGTTASNKSFFKIDNNELNYIGKDASSTVLNRATIYKSDMIRFTTHLSNESYKFFINLNELKERLRPFTKKNSVSLAKYRGKHQLFIQTSGSADEHGAQQVQFVNLLPMDSNVTFSVPNVLRVDYNNPNAVIYAQSLHNMNRSIATDQKIEIRGGKTFIYFGIISTGDKSTNCIWKFKAPHHSAATEDDNYIVRGITSGGVIKNLGRLSSLAPNAVIKVYFVSSNTIKLMAPIGNLGKLEVFVTLSPS